jgi:hypothetical protein
MALYGSLIKKGSIVKKVILTKGEDLSEDNGNGVLECMCTLIFSGDRSKELTEDSMVGLLYSGDKEVSFLIKGCELEDDKYSRGIYEYKNDTYIQIENWD